MMLPRRFYCLLLVLCLVTGVIGFVHAATESFNVEAGKDFVSKIAVSSGDRVQLSFVTTGLPSSNLCFSIVLPNSTVINIGEVGQYSNSFTSNVGGTYELRFDNSNSSDPVLVTLNYQVDHYILGMPEMIFVLAAIAVLLMAIVTGYIIMGKCSN
jgi:hypothetical protein